MDLEPGDEEDAEPPDARQAKKQKWSKDKEPDTSENTYTRNKWEDWSKKEYYDYTVDTKNPSKKEWDEASTKSEPKWAHGWVDNETKAGEFCKERKKTWGDTKTPADSSLPISADSAAPASSSWGAAPDWAAAESASAASEDAEEWRAYAHSDVRSEETKKYKETPSWERRRAVKAMTKTK